MSPTIDFAKKSRPFEPDASPKYRGALFVNNDNTLPKKRRTEREDFESNGEKYQSRKFLMN